MPERSADWWQQAQRDLQNARWEMEGGFYEWACFVAQQGAEKALKAVYHRLGGEAWGHTLVHLLEGLREKVSVPPAVQECGRLLDRFYIPTRYPNAWEQGAPSAFYSKEDAARAIACAEEILRFCNSLLAG